MNDRFHAPDRRCATSGCGAVKRPAWSGPGQVARGRRGGFSTSVDDANDANDHDPNRANSDDANVASDDDASGASGSHGASALPSSASYRPAEPLPPPDCSATAPLPAPRAHSAPAPRRARQAPKFFRPSCLLSQYRVRDSSAHSRKLRREGVERGMNAAAAKINGDGPVLDLSLSSDARKESVLARAPVAAHARHDDGAARPMLLHIEGIAFADGIRTGIIARVDFRRGLIVRIDPQTRRPTRRRRIGWRRLRHAKLRRRALRPQRNGPNHGADQCDREDRSDCFHDAHPNLSLFTCF